ncbi:hypothetical protein ACIA03_07470 [Nocardioides sp. NPDC051685]
MRKQFVTELHDVVSQHRALIAALATLTATPPATEPFIPAP